MPAHNALTTPLTALAEGLAMHCDEVWRLISDTDGQPVRGPRVRAHLRHCGACTAFASAIPERRAQLRALAPTLPAVAAGSILAQALGAGAAHSSDSAGLAGAGAGKAIGTAILTKASAVGLAATAAVGVTVALKHHGPPTHRSSPATRSAEHAAPRPASQVGAGGPSSPALPGLASMSDLLGAGHPSAAPVTPPHGRRAATRRGRAARGRSSSATPLASRNRTARGHHIAIAGRPAGTARPGPRRLGGGTPVTTGDPQGTLLNRARASATPRRGGLANGGPVSPTRRLEPGLALRTPQRAVLR